VSSVTPSTMASEEIPAAAERIRDEAIERGGEPRALYACLLPELQNADLAALARTVRDHLNERGVAFRTSDDVLPFHVDPVPRLIARSEWSALTWGIRQRVRALQAFVADVYGDQRIVRAGQVPARVIDTADHFEPDLVGIERPTHPVGVAGLDVVRGADGRLAVLEDNLRTPSGLSYAVAAREAVDAALPFSPPAGRVELDAGADLLLDALRAAAPDGVDDPSAAVLTDGPRSSAWFEHRDLSRRMGIPLVLRSDLCLRGDRLCAWGDDGRARELDVVYLRGDEDRLHDEHGRSTWLAELLLRPLRAGTLATINPLGAGVADDKLAHAYVGEMIRFYLGEEPLLQSVPTYDLADPEQRHSALDRIDDLVVKPRSGSGGAGIVICRHASREDRERIARAIEAEPERYIAQETVTLSTHPTVCGGELEPRHVDLRVFAIGDRVVPGGLTRFALARDALVVNSSQGGGAKDTWVVA
jgi:uncharacterized circularly permuted ATP-grasp superfamily protein